jgi:hypothetical protein
MAQRFCGKHWEPDRPLDRRLDPRRGEQRQKSPEIPFTQDLPGLKVTVPKTIQAGVQDIFYKDKVVLAFEGLTSLDQAKKWLLSFNNQQSLELAIFEPLANNLYMVEVRVPNPAKAVKKLLAGSPLALREHNTVRASKSMISVGAIALEDRKASVNTYSMFFDIEHPKEFKHLVYFQLREGNHRIFSIIDDLFSDIGKVVRSYISTGEDLHRIVVLVETTCKEFSSTLRVRYDSSNIKEIPLEIIDKHPRCHRCFSQAHRSGSCPSKIPKSGKAGVRGKRGEDQLYEPKRGGGEYSIQGKKKPTSARHSRDPEVEDLVTMTGKVPVTAAPKLQATQVPPEIQAIKTCRQEGHFFQEDTLTLAKFQLTGLRTEYQICEEKRKLKAAPTVIPAVAQPRVSPVGVSSPKPTPEAVAIRREPEGEQNLEASERSLLAGSSSAGSSAESKEEEQNFGRLGTQEKSQTPSVFKGQSRQTRPREQGH